jgi:hypothetical protein
LEKKTKYTFIPLPSIKDDPVTRRSVTLSPDTGHPVSSWDLHHHPYHTLPDLECHLAPPYVAINGGPKLANLDLDAVTLDYCESGNSRPALKRRLELLCEIWKTLQNEKDNANKWEVSKRGKRGRDQEDEDIERLTQSTKRTTRSAARASQDPAHDNTKSQRMSGHTSGPRKRKAEASLSGTTLTECAVRYHNKGQKASRFHNSVKRWAESIRG